MIQTHQNQHPLERIHFALVSDTIATHYLKAFQFLKPLIHAT